MCFASLNLLVGEAMLYRLSQSVEIRSVIILGCGLTLA